MSSLHSRWLCSCKSVFDKPAPAGSRSTPRFDSGCQAVGHSRSCDEAHKQVIQRKQLQTAHEDQVRLPRRTAVQLLVAATQICVSSQSALASPIAAAIDDDAGSSEAVLDSPPRPAPASIYATDEFSFLVPAGFKELEDIPDPDLNVNRPRSTNDGQQDNPIKVRFVSEDGKQVLSVFSRESSLIRPTFVQLTDIGQYGSPKEVAELLLPKGCRILSASSTKVALPPRDTGTVIGVVQLPPETIYRYEIQLGNGLRLAVAVAAAKGRVFVMSAAAPSSQWAAVGPMLKTSMESFVLSTGYSNVPSML